MAMTLYLTVKLRKRGNFMKSLLRFSALQLHGHCSLGELSYPEVYNTPHAIQFQSLIWVIHGMERMVEIGQDTREQPARTTQF